MNTHSLLHTTASVMAKATLWWLIIDQISPSLYILNDLLHSLASSPSYPPSVLQQFPLCLPLSPSPSLLSLLWHFLLSPCLFFLPPSSVARCLPAGQAFIWSMWTSLVTCVCVEGTDLFTGVCVSTSVCVWDRGADMSDRDVVLLLKSCWRPLTFWRASWEGEQ